MLYKEKQYLPNRVFTVLNVVLVQFVIGMSVFICYKLDLISDLTCNYFMYRNEETISFIVIYLIIFNSKSFLYLKDCFTPKVQDFSWIRFSLFIGLFQRMMTWLSIIAITSFGIDMTIGKNQAVGSDLLMDNLLGSGILAPLHEEFIYRVLFFAVAAGIIDWVLKNITKKTFII